MKVVVNRCITLAAHFLLLIGLLVAFNGPIFAAGTVQFTGTSKSVSVGDTVRIDLSFTTSAEQIQSGDYKINFPNGVSFESYIPSLSQFDAYNANIFNSPAGSTSIVLSFVSSASRTSGQIGSIYVKGVNEGSYQLTFSETAANDSTPSAETMSVVTQPITVNVSGKSSPATTTPAQSNSTTAPQSTNLVPEEVTSDVSPSAVAQPTNSVLVPASELEESFNVTEDNSVIEDSTLLDTNEINYDTLDSDGDKTYVALILLVGLFISVISMGFIAYFKFVKKKPKLSKDIISDHLIDDNKQTYLNDLSEIDEKSKPGNIIEPKDK